MCIKECKISNSIQFIKMKGIPFTILVVFLSSVLALDIPSIGSQVRAEKATEEKTSLADWLAQEEGLPRDVIDQIYNKESDAETQDSNLVKRGDVKSEKDQEVQEESAKEEAALEADSDQHLEKREVKGEDDQQVQEESVKEEAALETDQDTQQESEKPLQKRGCYQHRRCGGCGCGCRSKLRTECTKVAYCRHSQSQTLHHWTYFRNFIPKVYVAPLFRVRCGCTRQVGSVIVIQRGCRTHVIVKYNIVRPAIKRIRVCYRHTRCGGHCGVLRGFSGCGCSCGGKIGFAHGSFPCFGRGLSFGKGLHFGKGFRLGRITPIDKHWY
jgi:hypothetical protein